MSDPISKLEAVLTPARRKAIYRFFTAIFLILSVNGFVTAEEVNGYAQAIALALGVGATEMAATHVDEG